MFAQIISFQCTLRNNIGEQICTSLNRSVLSHFTDGQTGILSGLVKGMQNLKKGEKRLITVLAEEGYGAYDAAKVILFPRSKLPKTIRVDQTLQIVSKTGVERSYRILELHSDFARLDGNHPMSGKDLIFEIDTLEARAATREEITRSRNLVTAQILH